MEKLKPARTYGALSIVLFLTSYVWKEVGGVFFLYCFDWQMLLIITSLKNAWNQQFIKHMKTM